MINYYDLLDISENATAEEIDAKIKSEINRWRKRTNAPSPERQREANERMEYLRQAQEILLDPTKRRAYDEELRGSSQESIPNREEQRTTGNDGNDQQVRELYDRYNFYLDEENYGEAIEIAKQLTRLQPNNPYAWHDLAYANYQWDNYADARYEINHTLSLKQNEAYFFQTAHNIYFNSPDISEQESLQKAKEYIQKAIALDPENPAYQANLASVYYDEGYYNDAINILEPTLSKGNITDYGREILSRSYIRKVENECSVPVSYNNGSLRYYFTDPGNISTANEYLEKARSLAQLQRTEDRIHELSNAANRALKYQNNYKYLILLAIAALWFISALDGLKLFQILISGGIGYFAWTKFRVPVYKLNADYVRSLP